MSLVRVSKTFPNKGATCMPFPPFFEKIVQNFYRIPACTLAQVQCPLRQSQKKPIKYDALLSIHILI